MSPRSSARKKLVTKFRTSSSLIMLAIGAVVRVGNEVGGGGDCGVGVGTGVGTGVTAAGVIGTGGDVSIGVMTGCSGAPFFFWPRYHPAPPTSTRAAIMIPMRI